MVAQLLGIPFDGLQKALILKTRSTPTSQIESPIRLAECEAKREAFAKYLYDKVFTWLVLRLNRSILGKEQTKSIGLLDIFGFENFIINSFE
jgi:myosin heavy subunit